MSRCTARTVRPLLSTLALIAMGCAEQPAVPLADDVFWLEVTPEASNAPCEQAIDHNFEDVVPIGGGSGELTEYERRLESASGSYAYVTRQGPDRDLLNFTGNVYTGAWIDESTVEVAWSGSEELEQSTEFFEGYTFQAVGTRQLQETLALSSSGEPGAVFEGTLSVRQVEDLSYVESDEWDSTKSGIFLSSMPALDYLVPADGYGFVTNTSFTPNCTAADCRLEVVSDCEQVFTLTAYPVEGGIEAFEALDDYDRSGGVPATAP